MKAIEALYKIQEYVQLCDEFSETDGGAQVREWLASIIEEISVRGNSIDSETVLDSEEERVLEGLMREALEICQGRGHRLVRWTELGAYSKNAVMAVCRICGKTVIVDANPAPNSATMVGSALAMNCEE